MGFLVTNLKELENRCILIKDIVQITLGSLIIGYRFYSSSHISDPLILSPLAKEALIGCLLADLLILSPLANKVSIGCLLYPQLSFVSLCSCFSTLSKCENLEDKHNNSQLHPYFITGFTDGEGYFTVSIRRNNNMKTGWSVELIFGINLHRKDQALLQEIKSFLGVGRVTLRSDGAVQYRVSSIKDLAVINNFFDKYPLISQKNSEF